MAREEEWVELARRDKPGGWSHHIYDVSPNDLDARATHIADKFHALMLKHMIRRFGVAPYYGVEINWGLTGEHPEVYSNALEKYVQQTPELSDIIHRVYEDVGSVEVCTSPASPLDTIQRVNDIKQMAFEASQLHDGPNKSTWTDWVKKHMRPHVMRFIPENGCYNHGEHINVSLVYMKPSEDFDEKRRAKASYERTTLLARDNLFGTILTSAATRLRSSPAPETPKRFSNWYRIMEDMFNEYLSHDTILAVGNRKSIHPNMTPMGELDCDEELRRNDIKAKEQSDLYDEAPSNRSYGNRLEIRSFHDSTSNLSLSLLAITSVMFATLMAAREMDVMDKDHPVRMKPQPTLNESSAIKARMAELYNGNEYMPTSAKEMVQRFSKQSVTLEMMRYIAKEYAKTPEEQKQLLAEVEEFKEISTERAATLIREPWGGEARASRASYF